MTKLEKARLIEGYFQKAISKEDLKFLFTVGIAIPPVPWIRSNEEELKADNLKRRLITNIFRVRFQKIEWV